MTNEETMLQIMGLKNYLETEGYHKAQRELDGKALNVAIEVSNHNGNLQMDYSVRDRKKIY